VGDGFEVDPAAMREHASRLDQLAEQIGPAVDAARGVTLQTNAYGQLCAPLLAPILGWLEASALDTVSASRDALSTTAHAVRGVAGTYEELEKLLHAGFTSMMENRP
jgi:hypothetical protein